MIRSDKPSASFLYSFLKQIGIQDVVLCPGSRNLPLIEAFVSASDFRVTTIIDERSAGFVALGIAKATHLPVPVITTSGSALLNLGPALLEAFNTKIPLIAISADRPSDLIGKGENQTFNQVGVFRNFVNAQFEIEENIEFVAFERIANKLYSHLFNESVQGPCHINMPFSEPLLPKKHILGEFTFELVKNVQKRSLGTEKIGKYSNSRIIIYNSISNGSTGIKKALHEGVNRFNWIVVNEIESNIYDDKSIVFFDSILKSNEDLNFDVLITIGDQMISKSARKRFKEVKKLVHFDVSSYKRTWDAFTSNYHHIQMPIEEFLMSLIEMEFKCDEDFSRLLLKMNADAQNHHVSYTEKLTYSELSLVEYLIQSFKSSTTVFWGNSSLVRYANWCSRNPVVTNYLNRGISGIDGVLSTAIGFQSKAEVENFYVILGDVSMLYECNALQSIHLVDNIKIIVFNNFGGKIFENIHPNLDSDHPVMTKHDYNFYHLAKMYELDYYHVDSLEEFNSVYQRFKSLTQSCAILEISLPECSNSDWNKYFRDRK